MKYKNDITICDALINVFTKYGPMTVNEACDRIVKDNIYHFNTAKPISVVEPTLKRKCEGFENYSKAYEIKCFKVVDKKNNKLVFDVITSDTKVPTVDEDVRDNEEHVDNINYCYQRYKSDLKNKLLEKIHNNNSDYFEKLVINLLLQMGYGYNEKAGQKVGQSHDGGIDGIIYEDELYLEKIYVQAKRYKVGNNISAEKIQSFVGAIGQGSKGVYITTSDFTSEARKYVEQQTTAKLSLINGDMLSELIIKHKLGLKVVETYCLYEIDEDFYSE